MNNDNNINVELVGDKDYGFKMTVNGKVVSSSYLTRDKAYCDYITNLLYKIEKAQSCLHIPGF